MACPIKLMISLSESIVLFAIILNLKDRTIAQLVVNVYSIWIIIVLGLTIVLDLEIENILCYF
jgi:hypothetical protein